MPINNLSTSEGNHCIFFLQYITIFFLNYNYLYVYFRKRQTAFAHKI